MLRNIENSQEDNKKLIETNKKLLEEYSQAQVQLSLKEKEYNSLRSNLNQLLDQIEETKKAENSNKSNPNRIKRTNTNANYKIRNYLRNHYSKEYADFQESIKSNSNFDFKSNQEDIIILLEAINLLRHQRNIDITSELSKENLEFYLAISNEYSLNNEDDNLIEEKIIEFIEKIVNACHSTGKIREVEISQVTSTEYKFDDKNADLLFDSDNLFVKNDGGISFEDWLIKNFSVKNRHNEISSTQLSDNREINNNSNSNTNNAQSSTNSNVKNPNSTTNTKSKNEGFGKKR